MLGVREKQLARLIMGGESNSLMADGYKFAMAQAGFPLRPETFYFTCRKGDPLYIAFDLEVVVREFLPKRLPNGKERGFLQAHGYGLTPAMEEALMGDIEVWCAPQGSWVLPGEPILTISGPSFLVSWLEPLVIMLNFPLQVATHFRNKGFMKDCKASCKTELSIVCLCAEATGTSTGVDWSPEPDKYILGVLSRLDALSAALNGELTRAFEVGMRAATCMEQHRLALTACRQRGLFNTSNVYLAWQLYMVPVGTTGHEHQQRWAAFGGDDTTGFRAVRDARKEPPSYLFDTIDPMRVGLCAAAEVMREDPTRACSLRFDSGDQQEQFELLQKLCRAQEEFHVSTGTVAKSPPLYPTAIFEDGFNAEKTVRTEQLCDEYRWDRARRLYGYGGYLIYDGNLHPFGRDAVSACFKLTQTAGVGVMKHSGTPGKASVPGRPIIFRRYYDSTPEPGAESLVGQMGEKPPPGFGVLGEDLTILYKPNKSEKSRETRHLIDLANSRRAQALIAGRERAARLGFAKEIPE